MTDAYREFLERKIRLASADGFAVEPSEINPALKDFVREIVRWAIRGGRRAIFAAFGLHKTSAQIELARLAIKHRNALALIVVPLGVRQEFMDEAAARFTGPFAVKMKFIRRTEDAEPGVINLTNYESVREGKVDPSAFGFASLDEAAVLRSFGSKTFQEFMPLFEGVPLRFVATATPSPNRTKELIHYAGWLGIMDTGQALTRFFQRNSEKAGELTLYPHKEDEFWLWVHSWAVFLQRPSDLGFPDDGYDLPPITVNWHEVPTDHRAAGADRDGQGLLFRNSAMGVGQAASARRDSLAPRVAKMLEIMAEDPGAHRILWHDLEAERHAIEAAVPGVRSIFGSQAIEVNEANALDFKHGRCRDLATKPEMSGAGCNFQFHCAWAIFLGVGFKFHDFIQAVHRIVRFGQARPCRIDIIHSEAERDVRRNLETKWREHEALVERMSEIIRKYGLNQIDAGAALKRTIGVERAEASGERFTVARNDCVEEARGMAEASVDLIVSSIPFANHYEYTPTYNDFGHTDDNAQFWAQMDFLTPELFRALQPGRLACIHVKDRILFGNVTGAGAPTVSPFHAEAIFHYRRHGFDFAGMITVITDVVRENNQTYRLGWSEQCKDGTKMGVGSPEYVLLFRKPQSDRSRGYADVPVTKDKAAYTRSRWQIDAHAFWRSSGERLPKPEEIAALGPANLAKLFTEWSLDEVYDYEDHVRLGEELDKRGALPSTFMSLAPGSWHPDVWHDVTRMKTLNGSQARRNVEQHVCPLQFDIVDRLITRYSNEGETVFDPFGGIMTVPYRAILLGRRGRGVELSAAYFADGVHYCRQAERERGTKTLFDLLAVEEAA
ncbi:MAG: DNA methylase N-4 [Rhodospirillales bacterium]|nr:DNA methylase N-4 [Rhodospirillales bacterium]